MSGTGLPNNNGQTTLDWGRPHYSDDHARHEYGSTAPVQRDLILRNPDGSFREKLVGVEADPQTSLYDFIKK